MAHISSISSAIFTDLSVATGTSSGGIAGSPAPATLDKAGFDALFVTATSVPKYFRVGNVREFPAVGAPPNIVNVPVYGQRQSQTIGAQSDAPSLEVTLNYVPALWAKGATASVFTAGEVSTRGTELGNIVGDGVSRAWRMTLLATQPVGATAGASLSQYDSLSTALGLVQNSIFYWLGKLESMLVTPSLSDSISATAAFSIQSDFYGPYTV